jgi:hypothetical protein
MKKLLALFSFLTLFIVANTVHASHIKLYVSEFNAVGVQNRDELKVTLQTLLSSRLNSDRVIAVGNSSEADVLVSGTYITIGKVFSIDAMARTAVGKTLTRVFVQGDVGEELIPVVGKLADKLSAELSKVPISAGTSPEAVPVPSPVLTGARSDFVKPQISAATNAKSEFIRPQESGLSSAGSWQSKRLEGAANIMATGSMLADGSRELFLAEERRITYYRQGSDTRLVAQIELGNGYNIVSVDTLESAAGTTELYLTVIRKGELASQIWQIKGEKLVSIAENLPWYFRSLNLAGGTKKLYVQAMGRDADFFGDVYEATRNGSEVTIKNPVKMPRYGNIYTFNQFKGGEGQTYTITISESGYLIVYDQSLKELWRSNDKFGGSELFFQKEDLDNMRTTGDKYRWIFMNMRIQVSGKGDILVGKNDGFWVLGNARSYKKGAVYNFAWNGSSLDEKWRTKDTQNYMPDYYYDESRNELLILQTVQRPGIATRGASSLSIKRVE